MSRKRIVAGVVISLVALLVGSALALSNITLLLGTIPNYDFGTAGPGYPVPATVQIHAFRMNPGDEIPWHFHKGLSYVILTHGTITEEHLVSADHCESEQFGEGAAFGEGPGQVHTVKNTGSDTAVIWWATVFPKSDGIVKFGPGFRLGGVYPAPVPNCSAQIQ
jgi:quercetin dioxygenase-like cupin family protein